MLKTRSPKRTRSRICLRARKGENANVYRLLGFAQTWTTGTGTGGATANISYQYDANGSLLKDGLRSYEFDAANRLADVTTGAGIDAPTTRYVHNALGQRLFKTEPLFAPVATGSNPSDPGVIQVLTNFFASLWGGTTTTATPSASEKLGYQYYYDEDGNLLGEIGAGGAQSTGNALYVYLPTPSGPMPIAAVINAKQYAVHTDHLNTPRRLTQSDKRVAWQWAFSAFGDEQPTTGAKRYVDPATTPNAGSTTIADVTFNLRYPGQYFDKESGLSYNYFRSYDAKTGRYSQSDPIDLAGGWNRYGYAEANALSNIDPTGLFVPANHNGITAEAIQIVGSPCPDLPGFVALADFLPGSQSPGNSFWHAMSDGTVGESAQSANAKYQKYVDEQIRGCSCAGLARALHAIQDFYSPAHAGFQPWNGSKVPSPMHVYRDSYPSKQSRQQAVDASVSAIRRYKEQCTQCLK
jgi:RHS repeat-associated protein